MRGFSSGTPGLLSLPSLYVLLLSLATPQNCRHHTDLRTRHLLDIHVLLPLRMCSRTLPVSLGPCTHALYGPRVVCSVAC